MKALSHNLVIVMKGQARQTRQERQLLARSELHNSGLIEISKILFEKDLSLGTSIIQISVESFTRLGKALYFKSIRSSNQIPEEVLLKILRYVLCSLNCLHQNDMVHGNFQLKDIVKANGSGILKVADQFMETKEENVIPIQSLSKPLNQLILNDCHFAPEILSKIAHSTSFQAYTPENDLWAVGIVFLQLALLKNLAPVIYDFQNMTINRNLLEFHVSQLKETFKYNTLYQILTQYLLNEDPEMRKLIHLKLESMEIFKDRRSSLGTSLQQDPKMRFQSIKEQLLGLPTYFTQTKQFKHLEYFRRSDYSMNSKLNESFEFIKIQDQQHELGRKCKSEGSQREQKDSLRLSNSQFIKKMVQNVEPIYEEVEEDSAEKKTNPKLQFFAEHGQGNPQKQEEVNTFETQQSGQLILDLTAEKRLIQQTSDKRNSRPNTESQIPSISSEERFAQNLLGIEITNRLTERQPRLMFSEKQSVIHQSLPADKVQNERIQQNISVQSCSNEKIKQEILETDQTQIMQQDEIISSQSHLSGNIVERRDLCGAERDLINSKISQKDSVINFQAKQCSFEQEILASSESFSQAEYLGQTEQFGQTNYLIQVPRSIQAKIQINERIPEFEILQKDGQTDPQQQAVFHQEDHQQKDIIILEPQEILSQNESNAQFSKHQTQNQFEILQKDGQTDPQQQAVFHQEGHQQKEIIILEPQEILSQNESNAQSSKHQTQNQFILRSSPTKCLAQDHCRKDNLNYQTDSSLKTIFSMFHQHNSQNMVQTLDNELQIAQDQFIIKSQDYQASLENRFSELTMRLEKAIQDSRMTRKNSKQRNKSDYCVEKANDMSLNNTTLDNSEVNQLKSFWSPELTQRE